MIDEDRTTSPTRCKLENSQALKELLLREAGMEVELGERKDIYDIDAERSETFPTSSARNRNNVRSNFVSEIRRDIDSSDGIPEEVLNKNKHACFEGVRMFLAGFCKDETKEMVEIAETKHGEIVDEVEKATHIIFSLDNVHCQVEEGQHPVTAKWFWESVQAGCTPDESEYSPVIEVIREMLETDDHYVYALELLIEMRNELVGDGSDSYDPCWIDKNPIDNFTKADVKYIFEKFPPIIAVHKRNYIKLHELFWNKEAQIGKIWLEFMDDFSEVYSSYINSHEICRQTFTEMDKNARFHAFVMTFESDSGWRRNRVINLLDRPSQKLPSVNIFLHACLERTIKNSDDYHSLQKAISTLENVLSRVEEARRNAEAFGLTVTLFFKIENFPPSLRVYSKGYLLECTMTALGGFFKESAKLVRLLLYTDRILFAKVCDVPINTAEFMTHVPFTSMSQVWFVHSEDSSTLRYFFLLFWSEQKMQKAVLEVNNEEETVKFLKQMKKQMLEQMRRGSVMDVTVDNLPKQYKNIVLASVCK